MNAKMLMMWMSGGLLSVSCYAQGTFQNLDFESATVGPDATPRTVSFALAFPGWSGEPGVGTLYNNLFIGSSGFALVDSGAPFSISISHYTAVLQAGVSGFQPDVSLFQTGLVPGGTMSLRFLAGEDFRGGMITTMNGQPLNTVVLQSFGFYNEYGADISAFAGQTAELRFTRPAVPGGNSLLLDNISFSPVAVPEPSTWALLALGSALFWRAARRRRK